MHMCREGSEEWIFGRVHIHPPPPPPASALKAWVCHLALIAA
jgi:hypothetical protein